LSEAGRQVSRRKIAFHVIILVLTVALTALSIWPGPGPAVLSP
jgi:hypothetical protein